MLRFPIRSAAIFLGLTCVPPLAPAWANAGDELLTLINAYRAAPGACEGRQSAPVGPLAPSTALANLDIAPGVDLHDALRHAGYFATRAENIQLSGPADPRSAMRALQQRYCRTLLNPGYAAAGVTHEGERWSVVFARPLLSPALGPWPQAGAAILRAVNAARARPRFCGSRHFPAAPPLAWNAALAHAALIHSSDMARRNYFSHAGKDGSDPGLRARRTGYRWTHIGENIAAGQGSPAEAVVGWLSSPGHCANIMSRDFREMGAAYAVNPDSDAGIYWTQEFGAAR